MAYGDSILDAALRTYTPLDTAGALEEGSKLAAFQQEQPLRVGMLQTQLDEAKTNLGVAKAEAPLEMALKKAQAKNQLFSQAVATATDPDSWDENMKQLATQGFPEAQQYVGRYTPVLQQRLMGVFGGQQGSVGVSADTGGLDQTAGATGGKAAPGGGLDYQFANTTPDQRAQSLRNLSLLSQGLENVKDPETWNALRHQLDTAGVPLMDQLGDYSPIKAASLYQRVQPILQYLQNRSIADQAGVPSPKAPPDIRTVGNSIFSIDPYAGTATQIGAAPKFAPGGTDMMGNPRVLNENTGTLSTGQPANDGVFGFDDFAQRINKLENGTGNRAAQNPNSSATGNGQFTDATWLKTIKTARPELAQAMTDGQLLQLRKDPAFSQEMTAEYAHSNAQLLAQNGQPINATTLGLAHRFGPQGAVMLLNSDPDAKMSSVLPADVIKANPGLANQKVGDYVSKLGQQLGMDPIGAPDSGQSGAGAQITGNTMEERLASVPQQFRSTIQAMLDGRAEALKGFVLRSPYGQAMMRMANDVDPAFDQSVFSQRVSTRRAFAPGGTVGKNITAINRVLGHAGNVLLPAFQALDNGQFPSWNAAANWIAQQTGNKAPTNAKQAVGAVAAEARKVFAANGGGNLTELKDWEDSFPINGSPSQQIGALKQFVGLMDSQIDTLQDQWDKSMGPTSHDKVVDLLSPAGKQSLSVLRGLNPDKGFHGQGGGAPGAARIIKYDPAGRRIGG